MQEVEIVNNERPFRSLLHAGMCTSYWCHLRGLSFRRAIPYEWGLILGYKTENRIDPGIHMLGMRFDLGIVWINADGKVVDLRYARKWLSVLFPKKAAKYALEILPQRLEEFQVGDQISFEDIV